MPDPEVPQPAGAGGLGRVFALLRLLGEAGPDRPPPAARLVAGQDGIIRHDLTRMRDHGGPEDPGPAGGGCLSPAR